jgi:D-amino-acid dehydrogenase
VSRVLIVGGGVIGLAIGYRLQQDGHEVTVLDRRAPEAESCSTGNAGMIVPSHFTPLAAPGMPRLGLRMMLRRDSPFGIERPLRPATAGWVRRFLAACRPETVRKNAPVLAAMNLRSRRLSEEWARTLGFPFAADGILMVCRRESTLTHEEELARQAANYGLRAQLISAEGLAGLEPNHPLRGAGAVWHLDDARLDPAALLIALRRELGPALHCGVHAAQLTDRGVRDAAGREWTADHTILAGGVETRDLARTGGLHLPLLGGKGYSFQIPGEAIRHAALLIEARLAVSPQPGYIRVSGGMFLGATEQGIDARRLAAIRTGLAQTYAGIESVLPPSPPVWTGLRPCSPDGMPYLGPFPGVSHRWVATGHGMMGVSLAAATAEWIADGLAGRSTAVDGTSMRPERYS